MFRLAIVAIDRQVVLLGVGLAALAVWLVRTLFVAVGRERPARPSDAAPADGIVPLANLVGVAARNNSVRPDLRVFERWTAAAPAAEGVRAGRLRGRVAVFSVFVGRDGAGWGDREIVEAFDAAERMGRWIEREAIRLEVAVNLELVDVAFVATDPAEETVEITPSLDPFRSGIAESDGDVKAIASASRAAASIGFTDLLDLIAEAERRVDHDATIWLVHLLRAGRSCVVRPERFGGTGGGVAICYARESNVPGPLDGLPYIDPATLAHEVMHLFGALDKYGTSLRSFPERSVTSRDIMRLDESRLARLRIDPLTAIEIGWPTQPRSGAIKKRPAHRRLKDDAPGG